MVSGYDGGSEWPASTATRKPLSQLLPSSLR